MMLGQAPDPAGIAQEPRSTRVSWSSSAAGSTGSATTTGWRPFFMTVVGAGDAWLFVSSTGGLTAGRVAPDRRCSPTTPMTRWPRAPGAPAA